MERGLKKGVKIRWSVERRGDCLLSATEKNDGIHMIGAYLYVEIHTFKILRAEIKQNGNIYKVTELKGIEAYISGKKILKKALSESEFEKYTPLFIQCISALVQGETYVYRERGYKTKEEYNRYWDKLEDNGCRMYSKKMSHMRKNDLQWMDYVPDRFNKTKLFIREKFYEMRTEENASGVFAHLSDTYHEMKIHLKLTKEKEIGEMEIEMLRVPGKACYTNKENSKLLIGENICNLSKTKVIDLLGRSTGCYHIVEMFLDLQDMICG